MSAPRWEWRTFGSAFGRAEAAFAALEPTGVQESDELYLLSPDPTADTVKVRADLLDVKTLRDVDAQGLQRWEPTMKAAFPVSGDDLRAVLAAVRIEPPGALPETADLGAVRGRSSSPRARERSRSTSGASDTPSVAVRPNSRTSRRTGSARERSPWRTRTPRRSVAAVRSLGLEGHRNTSYPRGLAALLAARRRGTPS